jgi:2-polyprenyl-6-methoxyphenol hydroxylase-like FAD-dependent oxidoreductase
MRRSGAARTGSASYEVIVIGSRCAGAATAMLLARVGHHVVLVDRAVVPSDTLSTHGLARGGVVQLCRWGLLDAVLASGAPPARRVTFGVDGSPSASTGS